MKQYLNLLGHVIANGTRKPTRGVLASTGEHVHAISVFGAQFRHDLRDGFPALTTKRIPIKWVAVELCSFLRGDTTVDFMRHHGVTIWDEWATPEQTARFGRSAGDLGPVYGHQWRSFGATPRLVSTDIGGGPAPHNAGKGSLFAGYNDDGVDQIADVIKNIWHVKRDPFHASARRLIVSSWNAAEATQVALPPCHTLFQFGVTNGALFCHLFMRSADLFLGVPFNIASYALLTHIIAAVTGLDAGELVVSYSDLHIYENHLPQVEEQLAREPFELPGLILSVDQEYGDLRDLDPTLISLRDYNHHPAIKAEVAI